MRPEPSLHDGAVLAAARAVLCNTTEEASAAIGALCRRFCALEMLLRRQLMAPPAEGDAAWRRCVEEALTETAEIVALLQFEDRFRQSQVAVVRMLEALKTAAPDAGRVAALTAGFGPAAAMGEMELF